MGHPNYKNLTFADILPLTAGINPARAFGPAVVIPSFPNYHWIYWVGPLLGSLVAVFAYRIIKALEYEAYGATGQDSDQPAAPITPSAPVDTPLAPQATPIPPKQTV